MPIAKPSIGGISGKPKKHQCCRSKQYGPLQNVDKRFHFAARAHERLGSVRVFTRLRS
ncbi:MULTISPECIES: hypothetical protein [unclassified Anoxybacillus]|uniref:hypothetical protein n=1 Tax=unclassified Anoxybacillus TaxID=2639704 RepID=UPI000B10E443|nr:MULTISPECIES: hypothetical protein [unclassified Anoxybacillus]